jgi:hypothetical protein
MPSTISTDTIKQDDGRVLFKGRSGHIDYLGLGHQFSFYYEISGSPRGGIVISTPKECSALAEDDRLTILAELRQWLSEQGLFSNIEAPADSTEDSESCQIANCARRRLKGLYICRRHYDLGCIGSMI